MPRRRLLAALICLTMMVPLAAQVPETIDEQVLKSGRFSTDSNSLLDYLRKGAQREKNFGAEQVVAAARLLAQRQVGAAIDVLFDFLPHADNSYVEDEVLQALGRLIFRAGAVDAALSRMLRDERPERRSAAVYLLGRHGDVAARETVRQLLADGSSLVRRRAAESLLGKHLLQSLHDTAAADAALLQAHKIGVDEPALLDVLRQRTLSEEKERLIRTLIGQLGARTFRERLEATRKLTEIGAPALNFLREAEQSPDLETARRVQKIIDDIKQGPGPALPIAALRLLARPHDVPHSPAAAVRVILAYLPFADDESVEEQALGVLCVLSVREAKVDPLLPAALGDAQAGRRAAAALVLGKVGAREHVQALRKLLDDPAPTVRLRAAEGLVAARDPAGVPRLIACLADARPSHLWRIEETLQRLAGDQAPAESVADGAADARQKTLQAWEKWWQTHGSRVELARLSEQLPVLGLVTVCEYDSAVGRPGGQVWECGHDGKPRWKITGILGAMDAQVLPNGHVLVAENAAQRVTERDLKGAIKWDLAVPGNPICVQRLPSGNTFVATYNLVMEVTPTKQVVFQTNRGPSFYIFSAQKLRNGHVVCVTAQGKVLEFDPISGKDIDRGLNVGPNGGWCSVEALPNGRYLVAAMNNNQVREMDAAGQTKWTCDYQGAFRATRLPNGHTLVASMTLRKVGEFDRQGKLIREIQCEGRPWSVRYR